MDSIEETMSERNQRLAIDDARPDQILTVEDSMPERQHSSDIVEATIPEETPPEATPPEEAPLEAEPPEEAPLEAEPLGGTPTHDFQSVGQGWTPSHGDQEFSPLEPSPTESLPNSGREQSPVTPTPSVSASSVPTENIVFQHGGPTHAVPEFPDFDAVRCGKCGGFVERSRTRQRAKGRGQYNCMTCLAKCSSLIRNYGTWPSQGFQGLTDEQQQLFYQECKNKGIKISLFNFEKISSKNTL